MASARLCVLAPPGRIPPRGGPDPHPNILRDLAARPRSRCNDAMRGRVPARPVEFGRAHRGKRPRALSEVEARVRRGYQEINHRGWQKQLMEAI